MTSVKDVDQLVDVIVQRARKGVNHGAIVRPEELVELVPDGESLNCRASRANGSLRLATIK